MAAADGAGLYQPFDVDGDAGPVDCLTGETLTCINSSVGITLPERVTTGAMCLVFGIFGVVTGIARWWCHVTCGRSSSVG